MTQIPSPKATWHTVFLAVFINLPVMTQHQIINWLILYHSVGAKDSHFIEF
ncbi:hypothetical protein EJK51_1602 [Moraxella catarrhalis]|nr:hypothetical protein MCR_1550 [Moraxella catarrhalis BBH18]AZQ87085.1 hypothetical protein EJK52_1602 [Moraxella catarrhalis]AZQ91398.1 hypothetical protein EJK51_1602 [Moraxella catarrhalis]